MPPDDSRSVDRVIGKLEGKMDSVCASTATMSEKIDKVSETIVGLSVNKVDKSICNEVQRRQEDHLTSALKEIKTVVKNGSNNQARKPWLVRARENITLTIAIMVGIGTIMTLAARGIMTAAEAIVDIKQTVRISAEQRQEDSEDLQQLQHTVSSIRSHQPKMVYVPVSPDAGISRYARRRARRSLRVGAGARRPATKVVRPPTNRGDAGP
jgi:hypothetical protein